jgi:hypothetical protein
MKGDLKSSTLALDVANKISSFTSYSPARGSLKFLSRSFIPIQFYNSISTFFRSTFHPQSKWKMESRQCKELSNLKRCGLIVKEGAYASGATISLLTLADSISLKKIAQNKEISIKFSMAGSVFSLVGSLGSVVESVFKIKLNKVTVAEHSKRYEKDMQSINKKEASKLMGNCFSFLSSSLGLLSFFVISPVSSIMQIFCQSISFLISARKKFQF